MNGGQEPRRLYIRGGGTFDLPSWFTDEDEDKFRAAFPDHILSDPTVFGALGEAVPRLFRGIGSAALQMGIGITGFLPGDTGARGLLTRGTDYLRSKDDERYDDSLIAGLGGALGSTIPYLLGGAIGIGTKGVMALGAMAGAGEQTSRMDIAEAAGEHVGAFDRLLGVTLGSAIGTTEAIPIGRLTGATARRAARRAEQQMANKLIAEGIIKGTGKTLKQGATDVFEKIGSNWVGSAIYQGLEEGLQEFGAGTAQNALAQMYEDSPIWASAREAQLGFGAGAILDMFTRAAVKVGGGGVKRTSEAQKWGAERAGRNVLIAERILPAIKEVREAEAEAVNTGTGGLETVPTRFDRVLGFKENDDGTFTVIDVNTQEVLSEALPDKEAVQQAMEIRGAADLMNVVTAGVIMKLDARGLGGDPHAIHFGILVAHPEFNSVPTRMVASYLAEIDKVKGQTLDPRSQRAAQSIKLNEALLKLETGGKNFLSMAEAREHLGDKADGFFDIIADMDAYQLAAVNRDVSANLNKNGIPKLRDRGSANSSLDYVERSGLATDARMAGETVEYETVKVPHIVQAFKDKGYHVGERLEANDALSYIIERLTGTTKLNRNATKRLLMTRIAALPQRTGAPEKGYGLPDLTTLAYPIDLRNQYLSVIDQAGGAITQTELRGILNLNQQDFSALDKDMKLSGRVEQKKGKTRIVSEIQVQLNRNLDEGADLVQEVTHGSSVALMEKIIGAARQAESNETGKPVGDIDAERGSAKEAAESLSEIDRRNQDVANRVSRYMQTDMGFDEKVLIEFRDDIAAMAKAAGLMVTGTPVGALIDPVTAPGKILLSIGAVDPEGTMTAEEVFQALLPTLGKEQFRWSRNTDRFQDPEWRALKRMVKKVSVPDNVDPEAHRKGQTWFEMAEERLSNPKGLGSQEAIFEEAIATAYESFMRGDITYGGGRGLVSNVFKRTGDHFKRIVGIAQEAHLGPAMSIFHDVSEGVISGRLAGRGIYNIDGVIRTTQMVDREIIDAEKFSFEEASKEVGARVETEPEVKVPVIPTLDPDQVSSYEARANSAIAKLQEASEALGKKVADRVAATPLNLTKTTTYKQAAETAANLTDSELMERYKKAMRQAIEADAALEAKGGQGTGVRTFMGDAGIGGVAATGKGANEKGQLTQATARIAAFEAEILSRELQVPHPDEAFQDIDPDILPQSLISEYEKLDMLSDEEVLAALDKHEQEMSRESPTDMVRRAMLAGELRHRQIDRDTMEQAKLKQRVDTNLRDTLWEKAQEGETTVGGEDANVLIAAKAIRDAGGMTSQAEFNRLLEDEAAIPRDETYSQQMSAVMHKYLPHQLTDEKVEELRTKQESEQDNGDVMSTPRGGRNASVTALNVYYGSTATDAEGIAIGNMRLAQQWGKKDNAWSSKNQDRTPLPKGVKSSLNLEESKKNFWERVEDGFAERSILGALDAAFDVEYVKFRENIREQILDMRLRERTLSTRAVQRKWEQDRETDPTALRMLADWTSIRMITMMDKTAGTNAATMKHGAPVYYNGLIKHAPIVVDGKELRGLFDVFFLLKGANGLVYTDHAQEFLVAKKNRSLHRKAQEARAVLRNAGRGTITKQQRKNLKEIIDKGENLPGGDTIADVNTKINHFETGENFQPVRDFAKAWGVFNNQMITFMKDTDLISEEQAEEWTDGDFIPFYRTSTKDFWTGIFGRRKDKASRINVAEIPLTGAKLELDVDLFTALLGNVERITRDGIVNMAHQKVARDVLLLKEGKFVDQGDDKAGAIRYMVKGEEYWVLPEDELLVASVIGQNDDFFSGFFTKALITPARYLREFITRSPAFLARNPFKDALHVWGATGADVTPFVAQWKKVWAGNEWVGRDTLNKAESLNIAISPDYQNSYDDVERETRSRLKRMGNTDGLLRKVWDGLGDLSRLSDAVSRMAVYDAVLEQTDNEAEAAWQAEEIINYTRRGKNPYWRMATATIPFLNARFQGMDVMWRGFKGEYTANPENQGDVDAIRKRVMYRGAMLAGTTGLYYMLVGDQEWYKNARDEIKDDYWLIPVGGGNIVHIPIPFEVGLLFKTLPEQALRAMGEEGYDWGNAAKGAGRALTQATMFNPVPQAVAPLMDVLVNRDNYTGRAIVPDYMLQGARAEDQRDLNTSELAVLIGAIGHISPKKIQYLMEGYLGPMGIYAAMVGDKLARINFVRKAVDLVPGTTIQTIPTPSAATSSGSIFDILMSGAGTRMDLGTIRAIPGIGSFVRKGGGGYQEAFYELSQEVGEMVTAVNKARSEGRFEDAQLIISTNRALLNLRGTVNGLNRYMKSWRNRRDRVIMNPNLTPSDKRERVESMEEQRDIRLSIVPVLREAAKKRAS